MTYSSFSPTIKWGHGEQYIGRAGIKRIRELEMAAVEGGGPVPIGYSSLISMMDSIGCAQLLFTCAKEGWTDRPNRVYLHFELHCPVVGFNIPFQQLSLALKLKDLNIRQVQMHKDGCKIIISGYAYLGCDLEAKE